MKEMIDFSGQLLQDLTPVVELVRQQSQSQSGNGDVNLFLSDDQRSITIQGDKMEKGVEFPLPHEVEWSPFGVIDGHFADLHKNDGGYWSYKK